MDNTARLKRIEWLAEMLDSRYRIPGTKIRFGWDGILSVLPVAGDTVALGLSAYLMYEAWQGGASKTTMAKMAGNTGVDYVIGSIPVIGTVFDIAFKANTRNRELLLTELRRREEARLNEIERDAA
ncbi:DUF4112 domain-containing protein [Pontivivens insulae]|uniref:DUF4112 domain-containing protein n=1 Tax=Pontivivens insulae TaxID=1639689 RepID=A0A2R8AFF8_9RHOB|nr:DUF4112 domain-containing protein [Pontivivens insulae]RED12054.1 uncharacterized protein DUF4112 [Pontivivens insulae]SPF30810.1 hypothetical protein POI8812_03154 [Pontivivens insulae]